jgi:hypothetical protein
VGYWSFITTTRTEQQSRLGLLAAGYEAEDLCEALPIWIAGVEKE